MHGVNMRRSRQKSTYYTITVTGSGNSSYCYLTVDGTNVTAATTYKLKRDSEIQCYASSNRSSRSGTVTCNGSTVASGRPATYSYVVTKDATIALSVTTGSTKAGTITIAES